MYCVIYERSLNGVKIGNVNARFHKIFDKDRPTTCIAFFLQRMKLASIADLQNLPKMAPDLRRH